MRLVVGIPEPHISAAVLEPAAEAVTRLDEQLIERGEVPTFHEALNKGLVRWQPEAPGEERFDHARTVLNRGHGDCDDLAPWRAASMRATGEDPGARAVMKQKSPTLWHCVVQKSDGQIEDPSIEAGMHNARRSAANAAATPIIKPASVVGGSPRPHVCLRPVTVRGQIIGWQARVDTPMIHSVGATSTEAALVHLHYAPVASQAIVGVCNAAGELADASGTMVDPGTIAPVDAIAGLLSGLSPRQVAGVCGEQAVSRAMQWLDHAEGICGPLHFRPTASSVGLFGINIPFVDNAIKSVENLGVVQDVVHAVDSVSHVLEPVMDVGKEILTAAQGVVSLIPGIGTGISAALSAGLAILEGGSPLEIAIKAAYGAIPIPPGIRNLTDIVLDACLALMKSGNLEDAAISAARSQVPSGLCQDVFDTLVHLIVQAIKKKPTLAISTPKPGTPPGAPVSMSVGSLISALAPGGQLVQVPAIPPKSLMAPMPKLPPPKPNLHLLKTAVTKIAPDLTKLKTQVAPVTTFATPAPQRPPLTIPPVTRPAFMTGLPANVLFMAPAGIALA